MKRFDLKQLIFFVLAVLSSRFTVAGVYPFIPALFMTGFMAGVNRSILFLCTIGGLIALAPVWVLVKYGLVVVVSMVLVLAVEWFEQHCRTSVAAVLTGGVTVAITFFWKAMQLHSMENMLSGVLEGIFIWGFIYVCSRLSGMFLDWEPQMQNPEQLNLRSGQRLNEYAESFEQLSRTFHQMNRYKDDFTAEELSRMQSEVTGRVCVSCSQCALCWEQEDTSMYQVLYRFLQSLQRGNAVEESARELQEYCPYSNEMVEQVLQVFEKARLNMAWYNRLQENRDVIAQQLNAMAYIMEDCAREEQDVTLREAKSAASIRYAVKEMGAVTEALRILEVSGGKLEVLFQGRTKGKKCISVREMAKIISSITGHSFSPLREGKALLGEKSAQLVFCENSRLSAHYGVARAVREDEQVSGDNFSFQILNSGKCVMCVSDGMGSGYAACKESEMVIDLIEKFMEAGFHPDTALRMMNSAMVTHGENNLFSTVDLMCMDLDSGVADFYKIGAAATFIRHGGEVRAVDCSGMPAGVFANLRIAKVSEQLESGDFIVMVTDGVLEHLHVPDAKETMADIIKNVSTNNPARFSKDILEQILLFTGGQVRDDMTVLTAGIWEK